VSLADRVRPSVLPVCQVSAKATAHGDAFALVFGANPGAAAISAKVSARAARTEDDEDESEEEGRASLRTGGVSSNFSVGRRVATLAATRGVPGGAAGTVQRVESGWVIVRVDGDDAAKGFRAANLRQIDDLGQIDGAAAAAVEPAVLIPGAGTTSPEGKLGGSSSSSSSSSSSGDRKAAAFAPGSTVEVLDSGVTGTVVEEGSGWVMVRLDGSHASEPKGFRAANLALRQPKAQAAARQAAVRQGSGDQDRSSGESSHEDGEIERAPTDLRVGDVVRSLSGAFRRGTVSAKIQGWTVVRVDDRDVKVRASQLTRLETIAGTAPTDARATANLVAAVAGEVAAIEEGEQKEEERLGLGERGREAADFSTGDVVRFDGGEANVVRTAKGWVMITSSSSSSEVGKRANQLTLVRRNHQAPPLRPAESAAEPDAPVIVEVVRRAKAVERIPEAATVRAPRQVVAPSRFRDSDSDESDAETSAVKAHSTARSKARSTARSKMGPRVKFGDLSPNDVVRTRSNRSDESVAPFNRGVVTSLRKYKEDGWATVRVGKGEHVELVKVRSADLERADGSDDEINENDENDQGGEVNQEEGFQKVPAAGNAPSVSADAAAILAVSAAPKFIPCAFGELSVGQRVLVHAALEATPATVRSLFDECCRCP